MKDYELKLTEEEVNTILLTLAQRPFIEVAELIEKIRGQALSCDETKNKEN